MKQVIQTSSSSRYMLNLRIFLLINEKTKRYREERENGPGKITPSSCMKPRGGVARVLIHSHLFGKMIYARVVKYYVGIDSVS